MNFENKSTGDTTNANRACRMILGPCTDGLRDLLRFYISPSNFPHIVNQKRVALLRLTSTQKELVFPTNGMYSGNYSDMDISLLYAMLRNICNIPAHSKGWGENPDPSDTTISAVIERIRELRNQCCHNAVPSLSSTEFESIFETIRSALNVIDGHLKNDSKYQREVDLLREESMDPKPFDDLWNELWKQKEEDKQEIIKAVERVLKRTHAKVEKPMDKKEEEPPAKKTMGENGQGRIQNKTEPPSTFYTFVTGVVAGAAGFYGVKWFLGLES